MGKNHKYYTGKGPMIVVLSLAIAISMGVIIFVTSGNIQSALIQVLLGGIMIWAIMQGVAISTYYQVSNSDLIYHSFGRSKKIALSRIKIVTSSDRPASGNSPAYANNGLMIHYGEGGLLYISPKEKQEFLNLLLSKNSKIINKT